ncbi:MAG: response regulator [Gemmatimonadota bacterium]
MSDEQPTILLVDDDDETRGSIRRVLEKKGYRVLEADGPVRATELAHRKGHDVDLVVMDVIMPGMSGISTADKLAAEIDELRILYISGFIEGELPERLESPGRSAFLQKPFTVGEMLEKIEELLSDDGGEETA